MKKILFSIIIICVCVITSCDEKHNHIGNLNGNWQLTSWVNTDDGVTVADKTSAIYYSISISLIKLWKPQKGNDYYLATFTNRNDSLILTQAYLSNSNVTDSLVNFKELSSYGIPENGSFRIVELTSDKMTLMSDRSTLTFRKN